ncbi:MAG: prepilin-type N-terminal cleavage/methylation domain-containing protein [Myxococcales bacterium]|nr:prepilin-type N-terminal cleavage/methylation domain-containing protein [Myxococcales bacterium]
MKRGHSPGFTLIEIVVAVALLAMLGIILSTATASLMGAIQDSRDMQDVYHTARVALGRMEREIAMAYLSKHQGEKPTTKTLFLGKSTTAQFTYTGHRRMARNARESDEGVVEFRLEKDPKDGQTMLVRREKVVIDESPTKGGRREVLARGVKSLKFAYWDMDKEAWQSDWKVEIDRIAEEKAKAQATANMATALTGNAALGKALADQKKEDKHGPDEQWLPGRVRIQLVLQTEDRELAFETQARLRLLQPLDFAGVTALKALESAGNPFMPMGSAPAPNLMQTIEQTLNPPPAPGSPGATKSQGGRP